MMLFSSAELSHKLSWRNVSVPSHFYPLHQSDLRWVTFCPFSCGKNNTTITFQLRFWFIKFITEFTYLSALSSKLSFSIKSSLLFFPLFGVVFTLKWKKSQTVTKNSCKVIVSFPELFKFAYKIYCSDSFIAMLQQARQTALMKLKRNVIYPGQTTSKV